jgi:hypothetical protein
MSETKGKVQGNETFEVIDKRGQENPGQEKSAKQENADTSVQREGVTKKPSVAQKVLANDFVGPFLKSGLIPQRYCIGTNSGKIEKLPKAFRVNKVDPPWMFVNNPPTGRFCQWQLDKAQVFKFVPRRCRACWKTVVYPRNILELLKLRDLQTQMAKADPACACKCGIELRTEVERNYGGYFYNNSKAGGLDKLKKVRMLVEKFVGKGIRVILKRGCTEFERDFGDSKEWDKYAAYNDLEDRLEAISYIEDEFHAQPKIVQDHVLATWLLFAASIKDETLMELTDGESMYPDYSTYEEEDDVPRNTKERANQAGKIQVYRPKTVLDD